MGIQIRPYTEDLVDKVQQFNGRLDAAGVPFHFRLPDSPRSVPLPKIDGRDIYQELFLALEKDQVRGGYTLVHQQLYLGGEMLSVASWREPISEGIFDKTYAPVGTQLGIHAHRRQPLLFSFGMRDYQEPICRIMKAMGWSLWGLPFYFKVKNGTRFLRNIRLLRKHWLQALAMDLVAVTGLGWVGSRLVNATLTGRRDLSIAVEPVEEFTTWSDGLWDACKDQYSMLAARDRNTLNFVYAPGREAFIRLKVSRGGKVIGWAVVCDVAASDDNEFGSLRVGKDFGSLRVGLIMDCLARPEDAAPVMRAAADWLEKLGVDLLVSNQSHPVWGAALKHAGFIRGPSNCIFGTSRVLTERLDRVDPMRIGLHWNRDGRPR